MALDFAAGCLGGCAGVLVGHPFDTIKVQLQTQPARRPLYRGTFHCFRTIVRTESVGGLYRGMAAPLAGVALINAVVFGVYGNTQRRMADPDSLRSHLVAGAAAGLAQSFVGGPVELAKIRIQVEASLGAAAAGAPAGPVRCLLGVARSEGVRAVWRGLGVTAARDAPAFAVYFVSYEWLSRVAAPEPGLPLSTGSILLMGGLAGTVSWVATFPLDVIKSRLQADGVGAAPRRYAGFWDCWRQSVRAEGVAFLWRGLGATVLRAFPMNAATFAVVTWVFRAAGADARAEDEALAAAAPVLPGDAKAGLLLGAGAPLFNWAAEPAPSGLPARLLALGQSLAAPRELFGALQTPQPLLPPQEAPKPPPEQPQQPQHPAAAGPPPLASDGDALLANYAPGARRLLPQDLVPDQSPRPYT